MNLNDTRWLFIATWALIGVGLICVRVDAGLFRIPRLRYGAAGACCIAAIVIHFVLQK